MLDEETRKAIIMEHYQNPINKNTIEDNNYQKTNMNSETCIDNIDLYILFEDNKIKDIHFNGEACAISTAASSIMIKLLIGKTIAEVKELINNYYNMINEKEYNAEILEEANCFEDIYKQKNRIGCATIPWNGIEKAIHEYESKN
ncbi:MAG: SUF system NifU family Fe-S cluster assembly protein [Bacilli bacterium]|nr:SUF system NifU family Fe-S cluster assembly protein [Bacilli bacterium]